MSRLSAPGASSLHFVPSGRRHPSAPGDGGVEGGAFAQSISLDAHAAAVFAARGRVRDEGAYNTRMTAEESWNEWRNRRNSTLADEHGWLSLVSLTWITPEPANLPDFLGLWHVVDGTVRAAFSSGDSVFRHGEALAGEVTFTFPNGSDMSLSSGTKVAEVARRGAGYLVRVRDSQAPTLTAFTGVPTYDYDPQAVVAGEFTPYSRPRDVAISTANPAVSGTAHLIGDVSFTYAGVSSRLAVQGGDGELTAVFHDGTNGVETADWRSVSFPAPAAGEAAVTIDFNRALNFPAAFTPFGTCPQPPAGNVIEAPVRAGERRP